MAGACICCGAPTRMFLSGKPRKRCDEHNRDGVAVPERRRETLRRYHERTKEARKRKAAEKWARMTPPEREADREGQRARVRRYWARNRVALRVQMHERRARISDGSATPEFTVALLAETHCAYCHEYTPPEKREVDHVRPIAKGGVHSADNLVMACRRCNRRKAATLPLQWFLGHGNKEKDRRYNAAYPRAAAVVHSRVL